MTAPKPDTPASRATKGARISTVVGVVVGGICCLFVGRTLVAKWSEISGELADADKIWFGAGFVCAGLAMTVMASGWTGVLALLGTKAERIQVIAWYYAGELGKYFPGGVLAVVGRGELAHRGGVARGRAYPSVALSLITLYLAAMFVATALLPFALADGGSLGPSAALLLLLPLGLAVLHPKILGPILDFVRRVTKRELPLEVPPWGSTVRVVASYAPAWVFVALATWSVAYAIDPEAGISQVAFAAVLSWIVGFLVFFVPGGVGVREAVFIAACGLDVGTATTVAVAARLLFITVDVLGFAVSSPFLRQAGGATESASQDA